MKIFIYGAGKCFEDYYRMIIGFEGKVDGIYDSTLVKTKKKCYKDIIPIVQNEEILECKESAKVYICLYNEDSIKNVQEIVQRNPNLIFVIPHHQAMNKITGKELLEKARESGKYSYNDCFDNKIVFDDTISEKILVEWQGGSASVKLGKNIRVESKVKIGIGNHGSVDIGDKVSFISATIIVAYGKLTIGKDCLLSSNVEIRNHDGHHIFDLSSGERINYSEDIVIGEHCWIGHNAIILKGVTIGNGSIVGLGSIVTKSCEENVVICGVPAKAVRNNIIWKRDLTCIFNYENCEL